MKKIFALATAALLFTGAAFAHEGKECCKKHGSKKECCKKGSESKDAKTTSTTKASGKKA